MSTQAHEKLALLVLLDSGQSSKSGYIKVGRDIQDPDVPSVRLIVLTERFEIGQMKTIQIHGGSPNAVIPPQRNTIPFHYLQESMQDGFFQRISGGIAIRICAAEIMIGVPSGIHSNNRP